MNTPLTTIGWNTQKAVQNSPLVGYWGWTGGQVDTGSTLSVILTGVDTDAQAGDIFLFIDGGFEGQSSIIQSVDPTVPSITLERPFQSTLGPLQVGDSFTVLRPMPVGLVWNGEQNGGALRVGNDSTHPLAVYIDSGVTIIPLSAVFLPVGTLGFAGVTTTYAALLSFAVNSVGQLKISNKLDKDVYLSFDSGTTDHWFLASGETNIIDLASNGYSLTSSQDIYVKSIGGNAVSGNIYAMGVYSV